MIMDFDVRSSLPQRRLASNNEPLTQATQVGAAGRLAAEFSEELRDLFMIICNNLARLRDELDGDDPRRLLVSSTLRVAQASAALTPECQHLTAHPFDGTKRAQFVSPGCAGCVGDTAAVTRLRAKELPQVSAESHIELSALTPRQLTVLHLLAEGLSTKDIARRVGIGPGTVKVHLAGIYRIIKSRSRLEAVIKARVLLAESSQALSP